MYSAKGLSLRFQGQCRIEAFSPKIGGNNETNRGYAHSTVEDANTRPRLSTSLLKLVRALGFKNSPTFDKMERRGMRVMKF